MRGETRGEGGLDFHQTSRVWWGAEKFGAGGIAATLPELPGGSAVARLMHLVQEFASHTNGQVVCPVAFAVNPVTHGTHPQVVAFTGGTFDVGATVQDE